MILSIMKSMFVSINVSLKQKFSKHLNKVATILNLLRTTNFLFVNKHIKVNELKQNFSSYMFFSYNLKNIYKIFKNV